MDIFKTHKIKSAAISYHLEGNMLLMLELANSNFSLAKKKVDRANCFFFHPREIESLPNELMRF